MSTVGTGSMSRKNIIAQFGETPPRKGDIRVKHEPWMRFVRLVDTATGEMLKRCVAYDADEGWWEEHYPEPDPNVHKGKPVYRRHQAAFSVEWNA